MNSIHSWPLKAHTVKFTKCALDLTGLMSTAPQTFRAAAILNEQHTCMSNFCLQASRPGDPVDINLPAFNMLLSSQPVAAEQKYLSNTIARTGEGYPT